MPSDKIKLFGIKSGASALKISPRTLDRLAKKHDIGCVISGVRVLTTDDLDKITPLHLGYARGERVGKAKLTDEQVLAIVNERINEGVTGADLARKYGVNQATVNRILAGRGWRHIIGHDLHQRLRSARYVGEPYSPLRILTTSQVAFYRSRFCDGEKISVMAKEAGVSYSAMWSACTHRTFKEREHAF